MGGWVGWLVGWLLGWWARGLFGCFLCLVVWLFGCLVGGCGNHCGLVFPLAQAKLPDLAGVFCCARYRLLHVVLPAASLPSTSPWRLRAAVSYRSAATRGKTNPTADWASLAPFHQKLSFRFRGPYSLKDTFCLFET